MRFSDTKSQLSDFEMFGLSLLYLIACRRHSGSVFALGTILNVIYLRLTEY